jgi:hypothetical protein
MSGPQYYDGNMNRIRYVALAVSALFGGAVAFHMYGASVNESSLVLFMTAGVYWFIIGDMDVDKMLASAQVRLAEDT